MKAIVVTDQAAGTAGMTWTWTDRLDRDQRGPLASTERISGKTIIRVRP
jgi:hypothetical protein